MMTYPWPRCMAGLGSLLALEILLLSPCWSTSLCCLATCLGLALGCCSLSRSFRCRRYLLLLPSLGLLGCRVLRLLPQLWSLGLFLLDVVEGHSHDSLLELGHLACAFLRRLIHLALLMHAPPRLRPTQFH